MSKRNLLAGRTKVDGRFVETVKTKVERKDHKKKTYTQIVEKKVPVYVPVWVQNWVSSKTKEVEKFVWPSYKTDRERIKAVSQQFKHRPIQEVFEQIYGIQLNVNENTSLRINKTPQSLRIGDVIEMNVVSCIGKEMVFDSMNLKQDVRSNINIAKYKNIDGFELSKTPINVKVVAVTPQKVTVDPLAPMLDEWLNPILEDPDIQKVMTGVKPITVKNLRLTHGGYIGRAVIPNISRYLGEEYTIEAFIPGSQIVLNVEKNFESWVGKSVKAFVTSYIPKPNTIGQMSLICSTKDYLTHLGNLTMINVFKDWCEDNENWKNFSQTERDGVVTGVIYSSKKCGAFVEIPALNITGFVNLPADVLGEYPPQKKLKVNVASIEEPTHFDETFERIYHDEPYTVDENILRVCNIKPVLEMV